MSIPRCPLLKLMAYSTMTLFISFLFAVAFSPFSAIAYAPASPLFRRIIDRPPVSSSAFSQLQAASSSSLPTPEAIGLKTNLLERLSKLRTLQDVEGDTLVEDFGVKGGELNETTRAPQKVNYYAISESVGRAADDVLSVVDELAKVNPTEEPTKYLGDKENGDKSPLEGPWRLLFTTAADASFSKNSTRGDARVQNIVNGKKGRITNVIDFAPDKETGREPALKQLNVVIKAIPENEKRVSLQFKYAKAIVTKFFGIPLFGRTLPIYIPVPGPFITRLIVLFGRILRLGRKKGAAQKVPKAYFDVLYLDDDLRIHKTGDDNIFVQGRAKWKNATPLFQ